MSSRKNPILKSPKIRVGITIGDPSGVGPFIVSGALSKLKGLADFVIIGDAGVLKRSSPKQSLPRDAELADLSNVNKKSFSFGKIRPEYGKASMEYLDRALDMLKRNRIDCLVTCPISKESINLAGYKYSGHTEYLEEKTDTDFTVMMLLNKKLTFSLITRHIPLNKVASGLSKEGIYNNIKLTAKSLKELFLIRHPSIVVCGLNPHASDNGLIGEEENKVIEPALKNCRRALKIKIEGPFSADSAIQKALKGYYDAVVAIYHDQALIPLKLIAPETGVNLTLGLPFIRTSPLHGTGFDIVKKPRLIRDNSFVQAVKLAVQCTLNQKKD